MTVSSPQYETMEDLKKLVDANGGVLTVSMEGLRDAYGAGRLGVNVRAAIAKALAGHGLGHYPVDGRDGGRMPEFQTDAVRIYKLGSPIADLIDAVLSPTSQHDEELRQAVGGDSAAILAQVRKLVGR